MLTSRFKRLAKWRGALVTQRGRGFGLSRTAVDKSFTLMVLRPTQPSVPPG